VAGCSLLVNAATRAATTPQGEHHDHPAGQRRIATTAKVGFDGLSATGAALARLPRSSSSWISVICVA
jgi:hypothetical protein